jgi:hypothetical protein
MFLEIKQILSLNIYQEMKLKTLLAYKVEVGGFEPPSKHLILNYYNLHS